MADEFGTQIQLAALMGCHKSTVSKWKAAGKLEGLLREDGLINLTQAVKKIPERISPIQQASINSRWGKDNLKEQPSADAPSEAEVKEAAEAAGIDVTVSISEAQRLKTVYEAALKKLEFEQSKGNYIEAAEICKAAFEAARQARDQFLAIPDRCAPLLAAETETFEVRKLLTEEINHVLNQYETELQKHGRTLNTSK